jgi:dTDP-glucose 4,6-dehydratase
MTQYQPKNMLVTGSAGFIGCNFVRYLLEKYRDLRVISLDKLTYAGRKENLPNDPNHIFIHGDIGDRVLVDQLLRDYDIDTIAHLAAESHVDRSIEGPAVFVETNVMGTFTLLDAAKKYWLLEKKWGADECRFHHVSTDEVYGQLKMDDPAFTEATPYHPSSPYSASKASSDHFVRAYQHTYGLPCTISNCSNNYGPFQHDEKLIPTVIRSCIFEKQIPVYGNGSNIRDWLYVEDHCNAIDTILRTGKIGETYNVGGKCERDNLTLIKEICALLDEKRPIQKKHESLISFVEDRAGHDWRYAIDNTKIQTELGWKPKHQIKNGLEKTVDFYIKKYV